MKHDEIQYPSDLPDERLEPIRLVIEVGKAAPASISAQIGGGVL